MELRPRRERSGQVAWAPASMLYARTSSEAEAHFLGGIQGGENLPIPQGLLPSVLNVHHGLDAGSLSFQLLGFY